MEFTQHAEARKRSRGISSFEVDCILEFGDMALHQGREVYTFSKRSEKKLRSYMGKLGCETAKKMRGMFVVTAGDAVITVARQTQHLKRDRKLSPQYRGFQHVE